ncbi:hypothetical protein [Parapusillimonas granuli]|uniref:Uncharacterized protein n=1 Tax=Parapusillimonas granuli TaxID=380911 RepID=A0A853FZ10_9BURK|nr:hypothetical protein [Parapusillimonas granuli]MBB5214987.1 hypothetical protein [Parapusillimonas granuli]NYT49309.1 hypothetical protein [Parapusillimonas granuli]
MRTWLGQLFRYALVIVEGMETNPDMGLDVVAEPKPAVMRSSPTWSRSPAVLQDDPGHYLRQS